MSTKPLPSIRETFSKDRYEESRKKVIMGSPYSAPSPKGSALEEHGLPSNTTVTTNENRQKTERPWCDHYENQGFQKKILENSWQTS